MTTTPAWCSSPAATAAATSALLLSPILLLLAAATAPTLSFGQLMNETRPECVGAFVRGAVCPLTLDNVLDIDGRSDGDEAACQYSCFRDRECSHFTYFRTMPLQLTSKLVSEARRKCVLFRSCPSLSTCSSCFTGPAVPDLMECMMMAGEGGEEVPQEEEKEEEDYDDDNESEIPSLVPGITQPPAEATPSVEREETETTAVTASTATTAEAEAEAEAAASSAVGAETAARRPTNAQQPRPRTPKQFGRNEDEDVGGDDNDDDQEFEVVGIDEGLLSGEEDPVELPPEQQSEDEEVSEDDEEGDDDDEEEEEEAFPDEYFDEDAERIPGGGLRPGAPRPPRRRPPFFHCVMGGYGPRGPLSGVGHLLPTTPTLSRTPRRVLVPSLPTEFPLGDEGMFSAVMGPTLFACSPGATIASERVFSPFFRFDPFGLRTTTTAASLQSGRCFSYSTALSAWQPFGGIMNTFRGGGTVTRMGRFLVVTGGRRFPSALGSIEVLNTRNPRRWVTLNRLALPRATFDHCVVAVNKTALLMTGGFGQESQAIMLDLKGKKWEARETMKQPRRKHTCLKARVNGRDGVIVAGGESDAADALASLEFYDLRQRRWLSLGRMRRGRRFPGLTVIAGNLIVSGGETTDPLGRTVILDSMETLRKRSWRPVKQRMPEPRSRFASVRIPRAFF